MANPQKELGHIEIANDIVEKLYSIPLSGAEYRVLFFILRKTWGWNKKKDRISITQLVTKTTLSRKAVCESLNKLVTKRLLVKEKGFVNTLQFNKDYDQWLVTKRTLGSYQTVTTLVTKRLLKLVTERKPTINNIDTTTKDNNNITTDVVTEKVNINFFLGLFKCINPSYDRLYVQKGQRDAVERLVKKYGEQKVENMIRALPGIISKKYAPQITTPYTLEAKLGDLLMFLKKENHGQPKVAVYPGK